MLQCAAHQLHSMLNMEACTSHHPVHPATSQGDSARPAWLCTTCSVQAALGTVWQLLRHVALGCQGIYRHDQDITIRTHDTVTHRSARTLAALSL